jgi:hypothetical protein
MSLRIAQILGPKRAPRARTWTPALAGAVVLTAAFAGTAYAPELVSFQAPQDLSSAVVSPAVPASEMKFVPRVPAVRASFKTQTAVNRATVVPTEAKVHHTRKPGVMLAEANAEQQPAPVLLLFQSSDGDMLGSPVWTLSVWRVTSQINGITRIEETFVMNSI